MDEKVKISTEYIKLDQLLKFAGAVSIGSEAKSLIAEGRVNLENVCIELDPKMNIICGENAQGKTNLIEAVWLCSGCRSFRGTREKDFIGFTKDAAKVGIIFSDNERKQEISFSVKKENPKEKTVNLNGVKLPLLSKLFGSFRCVVFTPEDLDLTKGTPDVRRHFLDLSISQIKPSYINALNKYNTILSHRNALLKSINNLNDEDESCLDIWNEQIAEAGAYISVLRYNFCLLLNEYTKQLYSSVTDGKEKLKTGYHSTVYEALDGEKDIKGKLKETVQGASACIDSCYAGGSQYNMFLLGYFAYIF